MLFTLAPIFLATALTALARLPVSLTPYEDDETKLQEFFKFVSKASIRKEFDESLGPINYIAARRDKAVLVSFPFPVTKILLLISAEPTVNIEILAKKVIQIFTDVI